MSVVRSSLMAAVLLAAASLGLLLLEVNAMIANPAKAKLAVAKLEGARYDGDKGVIFQRSENDCGVAAADMLLGNLGITVKYDVLKDEAHLSRRGINMLELERLLALHGVASSSWDVAPQDASVGLTPFIAFTSQHHFVVVTSISKGSVSVLDPALGRLTFPFKAFIKIWDGRSVLPTHVESREPLVHVRQN